MSKPETLYSERVLFINALSRLMRHHSEKLLEGYTLTYGEFRPDDIQQMIAEGLLERHYAYPMHVMQTQQMAFKARGTLFQFKTAVNNSEAAWRNLAPLYSAENPQLLARHPRDPELKSNPELNVKITKIEKE